MGGGLWVLLGRRRGLLSVEGGGLGYHCEEGICVGTSGERPSDSKVSEGIDFMGVSLPDE